MLLPKLNDYLVVAAHGGLIRSQCEVSVQVWTHLGLSNIFHCEVKPHPEAWVTRVRPDEEIKLKFTDVVNTAQVT